MHHDLIFVGSEGIEFGIDTSYFERELSSRNTPETIINHCLCFKQEVLLFKVHVIFSVAVLDTVGTEALCPLRCSEAYGHKFGGEICPTETESAQLLLSYKIDLMSVHKGLENITCIIWHILNLYTCSYGYMNGLISYLPESGSCRPPASPCLWLLLATPRVLFMSIWCKQSVWSFGF